MRDELTHRIDAAVHVRGAVAAHLNDEEGEVVLQHEPHPEDLDHEENLHRRPAEHEAHHDAYDERRDPALRAHRAPRDGHTAVQQTRDHHAVERAEEQERHDEAEHEED